MPTKIRNIKEYRDKLKAFRQCWQPHPGQLKILQAIFSDKVKKGGVKRVFIQAGRKFGKTELCMYAAWRVAYLNRRAQSYIIGPTRKQQGEILWHPQRLQTFGPKCGQEEFKSEFRIEFPWKSFIKVDGSENYEAYRGTEYDIMILDEFKDMDYRFYEAAYPNLLAKDGILIVIGTPPDKEDHYIKLRNKIREDPDWRFFYATSWENPMLPGGKEWLEAEKAKYYKWGDGAVWEREYEARFIPGGANAVFPMFSKRNNARSYEVLQAEIDRDKHKIQWYCVADPGTSTCFAVLFIAYNQYTSQVYVLDEIYETDRKETTALKIWDRVKAKKKELYPEGGEDRWTNVYDEAAIWFANEVANYYGDGMVPTHKASNNKESQISLIKHAMQADNAFRISDRCKNTIHEVVNYITEDDGSYPKKDDHTIDCLRYFYAASGYTFDVNATKKVMDPEMAPRYYTPEHDLREMRMQEDPLAHIYDLEDRWLN